MPQKARATETVSQIRAYLCALPAAMARQARSAGIARQARAMLMARVTVADGVSP